MDTDADARKMDGLTNYLRVLRKPEFNIFVYRLTVEPPIADVRSIRRVIEHPSVTARFKNAIPYLFGERLYLPIKVANFTMFPIPHLEHKHSSTTDPNAYLRITVKYLRVVPLRDQLVIYNCLFKSVSDVLNADLMKTKYFDEKQPISLDEWFLEIWPGLAVDIAITAEEDDSKQQQQQLLFTCDTSRSVLHRANVLDQIRLFAPNPNFKLLASRYIVGSYVTTRYGNSQQLYRIDAINFEASPLSTCEWLEGDDGCGEKQTTATYYDYFKQYWGLVIQDLNQPLLVHKKLLPKSNMMYNMYLVPELCTSTDDHLVFNRNAIQKVSRREPLSPACGQNLRYHKLMRYILAVCNNEDASQLLANWGLTLLPSSSVSELYNACSETTASTRGVQSTSGGIGMDRHQEKGNPMARSALLGEPFLKPVRMASNWLLVYSSEEKPYIDSFVALLLRNAALMSIRMGEPGKAIVQAGMDISYFTQNYVNAIIQNQNFNERVIVIVTPGNVESSFFLHHIKRYCSLNLGVPVQFVRGSLLVQRRKLTRLAPNLLVEMVCKAGGIPWTIQMPLPAVMFIGIDVYYRQKRDPTRGRNQSNTRSPVIAFVASMNYNGTAWYSRALIKEENAEDQKDAWRRYLFNESLGETITEVLYRYKTINNRLPEYLFVYRKKDNNDFPLEKQVSIEYSILENEIKRVYHLEALVNDPTNACTKKADFMPYIAFMAVTKGCSEKLNVSSNSSSSSTTTNKNGVELHRRASNHLMGDISFDQFFLLPQMRNFSAVSPICVHHLRAGNYSNRAIDLFFLQSLSYKLSQLFYNSKSAVRWPAPVVYAQRLATFVSSFLKSDTLTELNRRLNGKLFYI